MSDSEPKIADVHELKPVPGKPMPDSSKRHSGQQERHSDQQERHSGQQERHSGQQKRHLGQQERNSGQQNHDSDQENPNSGADFDYKKRNSSKDYPEIGFSGIGASMEAALKRRERRGGINRVSSEFVTLGGVPQQMAYGRESIVTTIWSPSEIQLDTKTSIDIYDDLDQLDAGSLDSITLRRQDSVFRRPVKQDVLNMELWWVTSPKWRRTTVFMCIILFSLTIVNAVVAAYFLSAAASEDAVDPYVCTTTACQDVADWIVRSMNESVNPCDNFYEFVCGNYESEKENPVSTPNFVSFRKARVDFTGGDTLIARLLKSTPENSDILIPFYKACLNTRRKDKNNMNLFVTILNEVLGEFFNNVSAVDSSTGPGRIMSFTGGGFGIFGYRFLDFPNIAFEPPVSINVTKTFYERNITIRTHIVPQMFQILWKALNFTNSPMTAEEASEGFWKYFDVITNVTLDTNGTDDPGITQDVRDRVVRILNFTFGSTWSLKTVDLANLRFHQSDINRLIQAVQQDSIIDPLEIQQGTVAFYIFNVMDFFAVDLRGRAFRELNLRPIFPDTTLPDGLNNDETHCFDSIFKHLRGYAALRVVKALESRMIKNSADAAADASFESTSSASSFEIVKRIHRTFRKFASTNVFTNLFPKHHILSTEAYASYKNLVKLNIPFIALDSGTKFIDESRYFQSLKIGPDHLINVYNAARLYQGGLKDSWQNKKHIDPKRQIHLLETMEQFPDNAVEYENNIYPSISLFDLPFFYSDFRPFGHGGHTLFLARSFLRLWRDNIRLLNSSEGPLAKFIDLNKWDKLIKEFLSELTEFTPACLSGNLTNFTAKYNMIINTLAFKIALENVRNPHIYETPRNKKTGELLPSIEPDFGVDGSVKYFDVPDRNSNKPPKLVNKADFDPFTSKDFKLIFTKAPGLEKYTEDQVLFITGVRHNCYVKDPPNAVEPKRPGIVEHMNEAMRQMTEFSQVWNCPADSHMNPPNKCL